MGLKSLVFLVASLVVVVVDDNWVLLLVVRCEVREEYSRLADDCVLGQ